MKSTSKRFAFNGIHVAIIMDGNGRWAERRACPRSSGHLEGRKAVVSVVRAAPDLEIGTLTLFAFSSDNWNRPEIEVSSLLNLLESYLRQGARDCSREGVRLNVIGRRDRLGASFLEAIREAEFRTTFCRRLHLRIAVDYSARGAIRRAADLYHGCGDFLEPLNQAVHSDPPAPPVDLLIRTGGEKRLSDFLLWESAYAELFFTDLMWPEFGAADLKAALEEFQSRDRRYGSLPKQTGGEVRSSKFEVRFR